MKEELFRQMISSIAEARKHRAGKPSKVRVTEYAEGAIRDASPAQVLATLMDANNLVSKDLAYIFGSARTVHKVLKGQRQMNVKQITALTRRFRISAAAFFPDVYSDDDTMTCGMCAQGKAEIVRGSLPSKWHGVKLTLQNIERYRCPECDEEFFSAQQCRTLGKARKQAYNKAEAFEKLHADLSKEFAQQVKELNRVKNVFAFHVNSDMMAVNRTDEEAVLSVVFYRFNHTVHFHYVGKVVFCRAIEVRSTPNGSYMCWGYTDSPNELCNNALPGNRVVDFVREAVNALI
jgi:YgiT-type zinc finger domain-containing protein